MNEEKQVVWVVKFGTDKDSVSLGIFSSLEKAEKSVFEDVNYSEDYRRDQGISTFGNIWVKYLLDGDEKGNSAFIIRETEVL